MGKRKFHGHGGGNRKKSSVKCPTVSAHIFGPVSVTSKHVGAKAFVFCHQQFQGLSKKELRNCFYKREVFLNDVAMEPGVKSEIYSVQLDDQLSVHRDLHAQKNDDVEAIHVNLQYANEHFAIVHKASGQSVSSSTCNVSASYFEDAVCRKVAAWNSTSASSHSSPPLVNDAHTPRDTVDFVPDHLPQPQLQPQPQPQPSSQYSKQGHLLYRLEKSVEGLCVVARTQSGLKILLKMIQQGVLQLKFTCVVSGHYGVVDSVTLLPQPPSASAMPPLTVEVKTLSRCRAAVNQCLSLVEVTVCPSAFASDVRGDESVGGDGDDEHSEVRTTITTLLRNVRSALRLHGMCVVGGDDGLVKKDKGFYLALTHVAFRGVAAERKREKFEEVASMFFEHFPLPSAQPSSQQPSGPPCHSLSPGDTESHTKTDDVVFSLPAPARFAKLLAKEHELFEAALRRDREKLKKHYFGDSSAAGGDGNDTHSGSSDDTHNHRALTAKCKQLEEGYPLEYLLNTAEFCGHRFFVSSDVMIPRKSSETLVHEVLCQVSLQLSSDANSSSEGGGGGGSDAKSSQEARRGSCRKVITLLDIGVGSGCLLVSSILLLQKKFPHIEFRGVGVDICPLALSVAQRNVRELGLSSSVTLLLHSLDQVDTLRETLRRRSLGSQKTTDDTTTGTNTNLAPFDIILCNPPYSSQGDQARLSSSRRIHEPSVALFAPDGREPTFVFQALAEAISRSLVSRGRTDGNTTGWSEEGVESAALMHTRSKLIVEFGHGQLDVVRGIFRRRANELEVVRVSRDCHKLERCVVYRVQ